MSIKQIYIKIFCGAYFYFLKTDEYDGYSDSFMLASNAVMMLCLIELFLISAIFFWADVSWFLAKINLKYLIIFALSIYILQLGYFAKINSYKKITKSIHFNEEAEKTATIKFFVITFFVSFIGLIASGFLTMP